MRERLRKPLGSVVDSKDLERFLTKSHIVVSVGDITTLTLYEKNYIPDIAVVDFKTKREYSEELKKKIDAVNSSVIKINNPAGSITDELWEAIVVAYKRRNMRIEVNGEEDLATLPCIFLAPENSIVIYGLPDVGLVVVKTTKEKKTEVGQILKRMVV
jgi:uncharacterized protein (UPF0218 family)